MGDGGIVVVMIHGDDGDHDRLSRVTGRLDEADVLELRVEGAMAPEVLEQANALASRHDVSLRVRHPQAEEG